MIPSARLIASTPGRLSFGFSQPIRLISIPGSFWTYSLGMVLAEPHQDDDLPAWTPHGGGSGSARMAKRLAMIWLSRAVVTGYS